MCGTPEKVFELDRARFMPAGVMCCLNHASGPRFGTGKIVMVAQDVDLNVTETRENDAWEDDGDL